MAATATESTNEDDDLSSDSSSSDSSSSDSSSSDSSIDEKLILKVAKLLKKQKKDKKNKKEKKKEKKNKKHKKHTKWNGDWNNYCVEFESIFLIQKHSEVPSYIIHLSTSYLKWNILFKIRR